MPYIERTDEEIVAAYEEWAEWHPYPDELVLSLGDKSYSAREIARAFRQCLESGDTENDLYKMFITWAKEAERKSNKDIVARIRRPIEASKRMNHKRIRVHGDAYGRTYDFECSWVSREALKAEFATESSPEHRIVLSPRYTGSVIGSNDLSRDQEFPETICAFLFDGEYTALAAFREREDEIEIVVHEH